MLETTLVVVERMGHVPYGVKLDATRARYARSKLTRPESLRLGDARALDIVDLPEINFSVTSPPYMNHDDPEDPLTAYRTAGRATRYICRVCATSTDNGGGG